MRCPLLVGPLLFCLLFTSSINVSSALKCYFCYGSDESGDCSLPQDEQGNTLVESTNTMRIISCMSADENCYKINYFFGDKPVTGRGCGNDSFCDNHMRQQQGQLRPYDGHSECNLCSRNLCNGSEVQLSVSRWIGGGLLMIMAGRIFLR